MRADRTAGFRSSSVHRSEDLADLVRERYCRSQAVVEAVRGILSNPKYTGYQVWNRRARKKRGNKANSVAEWVWSPPAPSTSP
ncbi:recombinase family protein [Streptomyces sp. NPDC050610]|uniref:recombinase family protein n=1 Tax=Streptomyces sp. NPDC050610 TaxID=3157097 RepID=UPI003441E67E